VDDDDDDDDDDGDESFRRGQTLRRGFAAGPHWKTSVPVLFYIGVSLPKVPRRACDS